MRVRDIMSTSVISVTPSVSVSVVREIMKWHGIRRLPVVRKGHVVGIVTDHDVPCSTPPDGPWEVRYQYENAPIGSLMKSPVVSIGPGAPVEAAVALMLRHKIGGLPVVDDDRVVGVVTESDIFRLFARLFGGEQGFLKVTIADTSDNRQRLTDMAAIPQLLSMFFSPLRPEILVVFVTPAGESDARRILADLRANQIAALDYYVSDAPGKIMSEPSVGGEQMTPFATSARSVV